jgi:membrane-associated phospholipid phosphatase
MKFPWKQYRWFYLPYILLWVVCAYFVLSVSKMDIHLWINQFNSSFFDHFFNFFTLLGDGIMLPFFLTVMLFRNFRMAILVVAVFLLSGAAVQVLKHSIFDDCLRPVAYIGNSHALHLVDGVKQYMNNSFPSGHSASAFGFFFCLALLFKNRFLQFAMLCVAITAAFSRIYLSQHFLIDTMFGSLIGVFTTILCYIWIFSYKADWLDKNIVNCWPKK